MKSGETVNVNGGNSDEALNTSFWHVKVFCLFLVMKIS